MASRVVEGSICTGHPAEIPTVDLVGASMLAIVQAIPELEARTGRSAVVIGGLAVLCRLGTAYRATSDLDTAHHRTKGEPAQIEVLLQYEGVTRAGPAGVWIPTPAGHVQVDVIEVTDAELMCLPDDETDRLAVLSHIWAIQTATPVKIRVANPAGDAAEVTVRVSEPGPLIAMKLQSIMNRPREKERTDLLDIVRLTLDRTAGPSVRAQLASADAQLAADARMHAHKWFTELSDQTLRLILELQESSGIDADTIQLVGELLMAELDRSESRTETETLSEA